MDSSVWIDFFSRAAGPAGKELHRMMSDSEPIALTGIVVTEILQGLTRDVAQIERYLTMLEMLEPRGFSTYREAAAIFRHARAKGLTLSTVDAVIAAVALENNAPVFTLDRDFSRLASLTGLSLYHP